MDDVVYITNTFLNPKPLCWDGLKQWEWSLCLEFLLLGLKKAALEEGFQD